MPITLSYNEKRNGCIWLVCFLVLLPWVNALAAVFFDIDPALQNLIYLCTNFSVVLWIFRKFLLGNLLVALDRVFPTVWYALLGYLGFETLGSLVAMLIYSLAPGYVNLNDLAVATMLRSNPMLGFAVAVLAPIAEETLFRGLVFRGLYDRSPVLAYGASMALFSLAHLSGYVGILSPVHLVLSFLQYLPAGYCLCFAYRSSGTVVSPILIHMAINAIGVYGMMR